MYLDKDHTSFMPNLQRLELRDIPLSIGIASGHHACNLNAIWQIGFQLDAIMNTLILFKCALKGI
jgi:hypothetical protein